MSLLGRGTVDRIARTVNDETVVVPSSAVRNCLTVLLCLSSSRRRA